MTANDNVVQIGDRYFIHSTQRWETIDGKDTSAIIKDRATNRCFIVVADPDMQKRVCEAMNIADAALDRAGEPEP